MKTNTLSDTSHFDMTPSEEARLNVMNARKLRRSEEAWMELCAIAQEHDPKTGHYKQITNFQVLDVFNRMMGDSLRIEDRRIP